MTHSFQVLIDETFAKACQFLQNSFENVENKNFEESKAIILKDLKNLNSYISPILVNTHAFLFDNLTTAVQNIKKLSVSSNDIIWLKNTFQEIANGLKESLKFLNEENSDQFNKITSKNLELTKLIFGLEVSYIVEDYTKKIIDSIDFSSQNLSQYYRRLDLLTHFNEVLIQEKQSTFLKLIKTLSALRVSNIENFNNLKDLSIILAKNLKIALHPLSNPSAIKEASLKINDSYSKESISIDSLISDYPFNSLEIFEFNRINNIFDNIIDKNNWPQFFEGPNSFLSIFSELKNYHHENSSTFLLFNCLISVLKNYFDFSYRFSVETLQVYLTSMKEMVNKLKDFLIICPEESKLKNEVRSNAIQLTRDFNQDFRDILSLLKQLQ